MPALRRVTALFACVLLFELLLVGSGYACGLMMPAAGGPERTAIGAPAGAIDADDGAGRDACAGSMATSGAPAESPAPDDAPCPLPWAPAGCHGAPCAPAAIAAAGPPPAPDRPRAQMLAPREPLPPHAVTRAPELPPPRA